MAAILRIENVYDGVTAKKDILKFQRIIQAVVIIIHTVAHTQQIRNPSEHQ